MKKFLFSIILTILLIASSVNAEFFSDVIVTSPNGIWTDSRAYSTLNDAIAAVGANERTIKIVSPQTVTTLTVPSNVTLEFDRDGSITNSGQLTINTRNIKAPNRQIFTGVGNIDFADGSVVKTGWFSNIETAFALTTNDTVTLVVSKPQTITASYSPGNNVHLKWEGPGNILTINAGRVVGNLKNIEAGNFQIFAGFGDLDFLDGTKLKLSWFNGLRSVITWVESEEVTLIIDEANSVTFTNTIPYNIDTVVLKGCVSTISAGVALTIQGSIEAGIYQIFDGSGTISVRGVMDKVWAAWWGFDTSASGAINAAAIQSALTTFNTTPGGVVQLHRGIFTVAPDVIDFAGMIGHSLIGVSNGGSYNNPNASGTELLFTGGVGSVGINIATGIGPGTQGSIQGNEIANIHIDGNDVLETGIKVAGAGNYIHDLSVEQCREYGLWLSNFTNSTKVERVMSRNNDTGAAGYGLYINGVNSTVYTIRDSNFSANNIGVRIEAGVNAVFDGTIVMESNQQEGMYIRRVAAANPINNIAFDGTLYFEENYVDTTAGYHLVIDTTGATPSGDDFPAHLTFDKIWMTLGNVTTANFIDILACRYVNFYDVILVSSGSTADKVRINGSYANYVNVYNTEGFNPLNGTYGLKGNRIKNGAETEEHGIVSYTGLTAPIIALGSAPTAGQTFPEGNVLYSSVSRTRAITVASELLMGFTIPANSVLIGAQLRVDTALNAGETWRANWYWNGARNVIISGAAEAVAKDTKVWGPFKRNFSGTGSITNGGTTDVITHGLGFAPPAESISVTLTENPTNTPGAIWVDTITATQFTVNSENDPGVSNLDFGWKVSMSDSPAFTVDIALTRSSGNNFSAVGDITGIVYYIDRELSNAP